MKDKDNEERRKGEKSASQEDDWRIRKFEDLKMKEGKPNHS